MSRIVRLTESDLTRIVRRVISEQDAVSVQKQGTALNISSYGRDNSNPNEVHMRRYGQQIYISCSGQLGYVFQDDKIAKLNDDNQKDLAALKTWVKDYCKYNPL
jgi:hypothetical protein